ncbi:MAG: T9SS type A sorting domain-containing protein, partial [Saprospiraceae bacterium]
FAIGDKLKIEKVGTTIYYKKNNTTFYTSSLVPTSDLYVDVNLFNSNSTIHNTYASFGCANICDDFNLVINAQNDETCLGANDGSVDIDELPSATYQWLDNPNITTADRNNLAPGYYVLVASSTLSCGDDTITVTIGSGIDLQTTIINQIDESCLGANDGSVNVSSNQTNVSYLWLDNNSTTANRTGMTQGTYTLVTTHDTFGCTDTLTVSIGGSSTPCSNYSYGNITQACDDNFFCIPLTATNTVSNGIQGFDFWLDYDSTLMIPTGVVTLGDVVTNGGTAGYNLYVPQAGQVHVGIYYTSGTGSYLTGSGSIACVEFRLLHNGMNQTGVYSLTDANVLEAYDATINSAIDVLTYANNGSLTLTTGNDILNGRLIYHDDSNNAIVNISGGTAQTIINTAVNNAGNCFMGAAASQIIDNTANAAHWGYYQVPMSSGNAVQVSRDIDNSTMVMDVINGADGVAIWEISSNANTSPTIYELIAADVNGSGIINSGDITLIHQRATMAITSYPNNTKDWEFLSDELLTQPQFKTIDNGGLADRFNVPSIDDCIAVQTVGNGCARADENIHGILIGDVNGNWNNITNGTDKSNDELVVDITNAINLGNNTYQIPVFYNATDLITSIDFNIDYDENVMSINDVITTTATQSAQYVWNDYQNENVLLSSSIVNGIQTNQPVFYIEVTVTSDLKSYHFGSNNTAYLNGELVDVTVLGTTSTENALLEDIQVYPNPFGNYFTVDYRNYINKVETIDLYTLNGQHIRTIDIENDGQSTINTNELSSGIYVISINNVKYIKVVKVD